MFFGCTVLPDSKETEFGSSDQEASPSTGKNTRVVLVLYCAGKCVLPAISGGVNIFEFLGYHLLWQMSSWLGLEKLLQGLVSHELTVYLSVFNLFLTELIITILSKGCKGLPLAWDLCLENSLLLMFLTGFTSLSVQLLFPLFLFLLMLVFFLQ